MMKHDTRTRKTQRIILFITLLLIAVSCASLFGLSNPVDLHLSTFIQSAGELTILEDSPVFFSLGNERAVGYTYTGNQRVTLTITSENALGHQMRLRHTSVVAFIPYSLTFDYGDGFQSPVVNATPREMVGFINGEYNLSGTFTILTVDSGAYRAGTYEDTITFYVEVL